MRDGLGGSLVTLAALASAACSLLAPSDAELRGSGGASSGGSAGASCNAEPVPATPQTPGIVLVVDGHGGLKPSGIFDRVESGVSQFAHHASVADTEAALVRPREFCCQGITADPAMNLLSTNADAIADELASDGISTSFHNVYTGVRNRDLYCDGASPCLLVLILGGAPVCDKINCDGPRLPEAIAAIPGPVYVLDVSGDWSDTELAEVAAGGSIVDATDAGLLAERLLDIAACRFERPAGMTQIELAWVSGLGAEPQPLVRVPSLEACSVDGWVLDAAGITLCAKACESIAPGGKPSGEIQIRACP